MLYYALTYEIKLVRRKYVPMMPVSSGINENQNQAKRADNMYRSCVILQKPGHIHYDPKVQYKDAKTIKAKKQSLIIIVFMFFYGLKTKITKQNKTKLSKIV